MAWQMTAGFAGTAISVVLGFCPATAKADEAYLCGPDTVVYVAAADLEAKKRSDPCIAAYYGLKVETAAKVATNAAEQTLKSAAAPELKTLAASEIPDRVASRRERQAALVMPAASEGTDYRNVRVLNAASSDQMWFKHSK
jgi:hypothetical protein